LEGYNVCKISFYYIHNKPLPMVNGHCHVCCNNFIMQIKEKIFKLKNKLWTMLVSNQKLPHCK